MLYQLILSKSWSDNSFNIIVKSYDIDKETEKQIQYGRGGRLNKSKLNIVSGLCNDEIWTTDESQIPSYKKKLVQYKLDKVNKILKDNMDLQDSLVNLFGRLGE